MHAVIDRSRPTTTKSRFTAASQQVLRVDHESTAPVAENIAARLLKAAERCLKKADILIISDYNKGVITPAMAKRLIALSRKMKIPVLADPKKPDPGIYAKADIITPNFAEMQLMAGEELRGTKDVARAASTIAAAHGIGNILTTMSSEGMLLAGRDGEMTHAPAQAKSVFDVSGAGDTVIAAMAAALAAGGSALDAVEIANTAAGIVVGKAGTATVTPGEVIAGMVSHAVPDRETALDQISRWRDDGDIIGFTNGCFDLLHPGHLHTLQAAAKTCDRLVVGLNSDASTRQLKGPGRPFQLEMTRAAILASLPMVDAVIIFDEATPARLIRAVQPDRLIKGGDYDPDKVIGRSTVQKRGGKVVIIPLRSGYSTTRLGSA